MSSLFEVIRTKLAADNAVKALVADTAGYRIFEASAGDAARPHIVLTLAASGEPFKTSDGTEAFGQYVLELAAVADTAKGARALASAAFTAIIDAHQAVAVGQLSDVSRQSVYDAPRIDAASTIFARVQLFDIDFRGLD